MGPQEWVQRLVREDTERLDALWSSGVPRPMEPSEKEAMDRFRDAVMRGTFDDHLIMMIEVLKQRRVHTTYGGR